MITSKKKHLCIIFISSISLWLLFFTLNCVEDIGSISTVINSQIPSWTMHPQMETNERREYADSSIITHKFSYLINVENACARNDPIELVMPVHSAVTNFDRRMETRHRPQGEYVSERKNKAVMLFFVALPSQTLANASLFQTMLQEESDHFGDIVQINMTDVYHNLSYKAMAVLQWVSTYCPKSRFVLKIDDDVVIEPRVFLPSLYEKHKLVDDFVTGLLWYRTPDRKRKSRWYISVEEYPDSQFPPYVIGRAIGYSTSSAIRIHQMAIRTKVVWLDDVFITGVCRERLEIPVFNDFRFKNIQRLRKPLHFVYR